VWNMAASLVWRSSLAHIARADSSMIGHYASPSASPSFTWLMSSIIRRILTRPKSWLAGEILAARPRMSDSESKDPKSYSALLSGI
jgi:hypothetical protein